MIAAIRAATVLVLMTDIGELAFVVHDDSGGLFLSLALMLQRMSLLLAKADMIIALSDLRFAGKADMGACARDVGS